MNINDQIHGFLVKEVKPLPELKATLVRMTYEKNGADLVWLDRDDINKTFAITFKTIPQDHTGVFHILEHSVLNGSKKYPVKEPFVELLKSSMNTFLNAMTFQDKTMYPICSRNDQDFLNLMDVYLDAVLHPLSIEDPHAFLQEGWHYELDDPDGELRINGVVYNEMKGAYADPDRVQESELCALLFPDVCYGYESGGHPDHVPELSYENYLASHKRFYHPSNARIFLDGRVDLDAVLGRIDEFLRDYDYLEMDTTIPVQAPVKPEIKTCLYEIGEEEDASNKAMLAWGSVYGTFADAQKAIAVSMLSDVLTGSNEAPLKRAILEAGLAEDVEFYNIDGIAQPYCAVSIKNVKPEDQDAVWEVLENTLRQQWENGLDHEQLGSILDSMEYANREKEFGAPVGLLLGIDAMVSWLYDGNPEDSLCKNHVFTALREGIGQGYFENLLRELYCSEHQAKLVMLPAKNLNAQKQEKERQRLAKIKEEKGRAWCEETAAFFRKFRQRQNTPDTPEQLATLPVLSLSDVPEEINVIPQTVSAVKDVTVLHQNVATDGITHLELYFSMDDLPAEKMAEVSLLGNLLGDTATEHYTVLQIQSLLNSKIGRFSVHPVVFEVDGQAKPYMTAKISLLDSKKQDALSLIREVLCSSRFDDLEYLFHMIQQMRITKEQEVIGAGNSYASLRLSAAWSAANALRERTSGIRYLRFLQGTEKEYEDKKEALSASLRDLMHLVFSAKRLTIGYTGQEDTPWISDVIGCFGDAAVGEKAAYQAEELRSEAFVIPAEVGFAAKYATAEPFGGAGYVAGRMLTYGHLWNEVRVKGGAYGTKLAVSDKGRASFSTYRDPNPLNSLKVFDASGDALRAFCDSDECIDRYIISTMNTIDPLLTPRFMGTTAAENYFEGRTNEKLQTIRSEVLHTKKDDLRILADKLDEICRKSAVCVIGGKSVLAPCENLFDTTEALQ